MKPTDAMRAPAILQRFHQFLDHTDPPASFKASEVAQELSHKELVALGYESWRDAVPAVIELAFELREEGSCELIKGGQVLGEDVGLYEVGGHDPSPSKISIITLCSLSTLRRFLCPFGAPRKMFTGHWPVNRWVCPTLVIPTDNILWNEKHEFSRANIFTEFERT